VFITEIIGVNAQLVVSRNWQGLSMGLVKVVISIVVVFASKRSFCCVQFALITIPAAVINSGLKYSSSLLSLMWRVRLSEHVHKVPITVNSTKKKKKKKKTQNSPAVSSWYIHVHIRDNTFVGLPERCEFLQSVQLGVLLCFAIVCVRKIAVAR
jgi:hypothetical protein